MKCYTPGPRAEEKGGWKAVKIRMLLPILLLLLRPPSLLTQQTGDDLQPAPRLAGVLALETLDTLWNGSAAGNPEALDITVAGGGPVLLFSDRVLALGSHLEVIPETVAGLFEGAQIPRGFIPSRLLLNPLAEAILCEAEEGALLLLHKDGTPPERFETSFPQALEAASLRRGGVALSDGRRISIFTRMQNTVSVRSFALPGGFATGLSIDDKDRLWVYDLAARTVRVLDADGRQLFTIRPQISGATLLFPQLLQARPQGGFFMGSGGELWCFDKEGSVRWRLTHYNAGYRRALPAFYRLAATRRSLFILDPLGKLLLKFVETGGEDGPDAIETRLAAAFQGERSLQSQQNEIVRLCLENDLLLQAAYFRRARSGEAVVTDMEERLKSKQARILAELAGRLEQQLRYGEVEAYYNHSLSLYRQLRNLDPVNPLYAEAVRDLNGERNAVRRLLVSDPLLEARIAPGGVLVEGETRSLAVILTNATDDALNQVEVSARFTGYPFSQWRGSFAGIPPGGQTTLRISFSAGEEGSSARLNAEQLYLACNLLVRYGAGREKRAQYFRIPLLVPEGTLVVPQGW